MASNDEWDALLSKLDIEDLVSQADNPDEFQLELKGLLDGYYKKDCSVLEAGSFTGITSLSLDCRFKKTLLDLNESAIDLSKKIFRHYNQDANFVVGDMFAMPFADDQFDIVFNAGVIEHFELEERAKALQEYARVVKQDGIIVIGYPNHYSLPYRQVYEYLTKTNRWPYPRECKIYDMKEEIDSAGLRLEKRMVLAKKTSYSYLSYLKKIPRYLSRMYYHFVDYEGYLTILCIKKP